MVLAPPQYTVWIYDFDAGTLSPMLSRGTGDRDRRARDPAGAHAACPPIIPDFNADQRRPSRRWSTTRSASQHQQRLRLRRRRHGEAEHRHAGRTPARRPSTPGRRASCASRRRSRSRRKTVRKIDQNGLWARRHGHARDPGLCAGPARRLGADPGAGAMCRSPSMSSMRTRRRITCAAHELDAAACPARPSPATAATRRATCRRPRTAAAA